VEGVYPELIIAGAGTEGYNVSNLGAQEAVGAEDPESWAGNSASRHFPTLLRYRKLTET
jgi:hypothetical protein